MADLTPQNVTASSQVSAFTEAFQQRKAQRSDSFKYYIHDGVECCRLQLFGEFSEAEVPDLTGCWNTVKTTLADRKLVLDVRGLKSADDLAKRWLIEMAAEGAKFLPESYLRDGLAGDSPVGAAPRVGLFSRLVSLLRGSPAMEA